MKYKPGDVVTLRGSVKQRMTIVGHDDEPLHSSFDIGPLTPEPPWRPGAWHVVWMVQGAIKTAVLREEVLMLAPDQPPAASV